LFAVKLEGAELGPDASLGKPFVIRCRPPSGSRVYFLRAASSQETRRYGACSMGILITERIFLCFYTKSESFI